MNDLKIKTAAILKFVNIKIVNNAIIAHILFFFRNEMTGFILPFWNAEFQLTYINKIKKLKINKARNLSLRKIPPYFISLELMTFNTVIFLFLAFASTSCTLKSIISIFIWT